MAKDLNKKYGKLQEKVEKTYKLRDKKTSKPKMKVTGKQVFKLQEIIKKK
ncbi:hypothetical protein HOG17_05290 [Candidatus Peregrinibacteria bacterium]|jgi:hypothetical protein|nr:hypothetical protein [Candidatus Peregrinibacteria bacterium]MBT4148183.1 hypothetical protein [Candidatus Peregrinibacteria bacterium]MBT4365894.1 hypothetical protein [Candidatus Peregrinibacteria bacterium]MBT4455657.1 hypothetical protein [Candidatus Peregrinibacteria bacterium]